MRNGRAKGIEQRAEGKIIGTRRKAQGARLRERAEGFANSEVGIRKAENRKRCRGSGGKIIGTRRKAQGARQRERAECKRQKTDCREY